jgi:hypothetical protein
MVDRAIIAEVRDFLLSLLTAQLRQLAAANAASTAAAAAAAGGGTFAVPSHDSFVSIAGIPRAVGRSRKRNSSTASSEGAGNSLSNSSRRLLPYRDALSYAFSFSSEVFFAYYFLTVFRIHDILVWIRIRIRGSMPLTNGSGFESCYFRH